MNEELKPCPFCGSAPEFLMISVRSGVRCGTCNARGPFDEGDDEDDVIDAWNLRS